MHCCPPQRLRSGQEFLMPPAATSKLDLRGVFGNSNFSLTEVPNDKRTAEWEQAREKAPDMALNLWGQGTDALAVRVAVRARPISAREKVEEAQECVTAIDNTQLKLGSKFFTFDAVYDGGSRQEVIYDDCVRELVTGCFSGYNATVLAYGQTGSGKTHTMGSSSVDTVLLEEQGIIPRAVRQMFEEIQHRKLAQPGWSCKVLVSFLEIYNEEFKDLLDTNLLVGTKGKNSISLREGPNGSILVVGACEESVSSYEEMLQCLEKGTVCRSVGSTSMNAVSSRSHAIFTVTIEQTSIDTDTHSSHENADGHKSAEASDASAVPLTPTVSSMTSKFHFVDLAGSERAKKTGAEGGRLKEGININYGLLVLGNVISALGDEARKGSHVPYRDSKLTRMLQDSIGGNSRTLMIACISPADSNFAESYNTITYANRARNIKNKPIVNRDARDAKMAAMMQQVARLKAERDAALKRAGLTMSDLEVGVPGEDAPGAVPGMGAMGQGKAVENDKLKAELSKRQQDNVKLLLRLEEAELQVTTLESQLKTHAQKMAHVQTERDTFRHRLELATGVPAGPLDGSTVLEEKEVQLAAMREEVARANESMHEMQLKVRRLESDVQKDQSVFSVQNKKIHFLSKKNQALKMENEGLARMSMSPMVKSLIQRSPPPSASAGVRVTPAAGEEEAKQQQHKQQGRKDSPTVMGHFRKKLDSLLSEHDDKERSDPVVLSEEELAELDSDEEGPEILEVPEADDVDAVLAEEEERRWRQGLLQTEVELRDWTSALDSKEKLLLQLEKEKTENEKLKMNYEVRMAAYEEAVKTAKGVEEAALSKLKQFEAVKGKDEDEIARLTKEHQQRVRELEQKMAKLKREEKEYTRWLQQRDKDQQRINALQAEIEKGKQSKNDLLRKMKEDENKYRDWRERHHREVQQLKRSAQKAEYTIRKLEAENKQFKAVLRRREEEKAALQREKREVALANASLAKSDKLSCATSLAGDGGGKGAACRSASALQVKTRSQVAHAERVDRFKMNRAKAKLKHMLEEYGQRGKLQAELARLKAENKSLVPETKELQVEKDTLELQVERSIVSRNRTSEAWGEEKRDSGTHVQDGLEGAADMQEAKNRLDHLRDMLEEKHTKLDYNRDRISAIDKKLKALPDFESSSGLWADDDTMEVPEAYAPIREANGAEAKFLLRFLFKKAAIFRESDLRARHQIELQRVAIEEQMRERDQAVGSMRRAELEFDQRCTQLQKQHQDKCLLLYTRLNAEPETAGATAEGWNGARDAEQRVGGDECYASPAGSGIIASTPSSVKASDKAALREAMLHRNEEIALLRAVNEELRETNEKIAGKLTEVEQVVDAVAPPLDGPSDTVRSLAERMMGLKKMLQNTKNSLNPHPSESPGLSNKVAEEASASTFKSNVFDRLTAQRNKVGQSKYKKLEQVARALRTRPVFVEWHEVAAEARADHASDKGEMRRSNDSTHVEAVEDTDKENAALQKRASAATVNVKLNLSSLVGAGDGEDGVGPVPGTPSHHTSSVFDRLQDPKSYTGIHKRNNVNALCALHEAPSSSVKPPPTHQHTSAKTPRGRLFAETPGR